MENFQDCKVYISVFLDRFSDQRTMKLFPAHQFLSSKGTEHEDQYRAWAARGANFLVATITSDPNHL